MADTTRYIHTESNMTEKRTHTMTLGVHFASVSTGWNGSALILEDNSGDVAPRKVTLKIDRPSDLEYIRERLQMIEDAWRRIGRWSRALLRSNRVTSYFNRGETIVIQPTIGRVVWFTPSVNDDPRSDIKQPLVGHVAYVWNDRLVNLAVFDQNGNSLGGRTSVTLLQDDDAKPETGYFASWMPYQKGQAAKTEALEAAGKAA